MTCIFDETFSDYIHFSFCTFKFNICITKYLKIQQKHFIIYLFFLTFHTYSIQKLLGIQYDLLIELVKSEMTKN